jgi:RNA 2',3'-cyclic 3'-phosphodiesterase
VRLFVALEIPSVVQDNFADLMVDFRVLKTKSPGTKLRWVDPKKLHVTLKFIGSVAPEQVDKIRSALTGVHSEQAVELRFRGLGCFPGAKRPQVVWAGVSGSQNLGAIAAAIDRVLAELGIPSERRTFTPHVTLARCEPEAISAEFRVAIDKNAGRDFGELRTNEFHLIESKLKPSGAEYTTLQSFVFAREA